jgi:predicted transcriptional regulator
MQTVQVAFYRKAYICLRIESQYRKAVYIEKTESQSIGAMSMVRLLKKRGRDRLSIIAKILEIAEEGALQTQIMYRANLSFSLLTEYMKFLLKNRLLEQTVYKGTRRYKTTPKGLMFLRRYNEVMEIVRSQEDTESQER